MDLSGVEVVQEGHHQTLTQIDLDQRHGHVLPAVHRRHLLQQSQRAGLIHLTAEEQFTQERQEEEFNWL